MDSSTLPDCRLTQEHSDRGVIYFEWGFHPAIRKDGDDDTEQFALGWSRSGSPGSHAVQWGSGSSRDTGFCHFRCPVIVTNRKSFETVDAHLQPFRVRFQRSRRVKTRLSEFSERSDRHKVGGGLPWRSRSAQGSQLHVYHAFGSSSNGHLRCPRNGVRSWNDRA